MATLAPNICLKKFAKVDLPVLFSLLTKQSIGSFFWLVLKNETTSGIIHNYKKQLHLLASKSGFSVRAIYKYITWAVNEGLLHVEGKNIIIHSYNVLKKYGICIDKRVGVLYLTKGQFSFP